MKLCPYCTKDIDDDAVKCKHCGGWLSDEADAKQKKIDQEKAVNKLLTPEKEEELQKHNENTEYFSVSARKLIFMSVLTFGIFEIYWFYKNWQAVKEQEGRKIRPFWRAVFSVLFCYSLFKRVLESAKAKGYKTKATAAGLAVFYIIISILANKSGDSEILWWFTFLSFVPLLSAASAIRFHNKQLNPDFTERSKLNGPEWTFAVIGGLLWALIILGVLFPEQESGEFADDQFHIEETMHPQP